MDRPRDLTIVTLSCPFFHGPLSGWGARRGGVAYCRLPSGQARMLSQETMVSLCMRGRYRGCP
ncbi:MAG TPA: hypothetical protein VGW35_05945, partial [Methylomirabilota bacterium]|nr:hypothetical protein [Methylomirabilota bacterium]